MRLDHLVQIYDLRYDRAHIENVQKATSQTKDFGLISEHGLFGSEEWWKAVADGTIPTYTIEGVISRVFMSGHNDYEEFEVDDGTKKTCWTRQTSEIPGSSLSRSQMADLYKEGKSVRITYVKQKFKKAIPGLGKESECVLGIWVTP